MGRRVLADTLLAAILAVLLVLGAGCSGKTAAQKSSPPPAGEQKPASVQQEVVLKAVTAWPEKIKDNAGFFFIRDEVNKAGQGKVRIEYLGGPEVIPAMEQIKAVQSGAVDMAWLSAAYTVSVVPEANALKLSPFTPQEERQNGVYDFFNRIFQQKANAVYLGRGMPGVSFRLYTSVPIAHIGDFKGKPIRVTPNYRDFVQALGASPVTMDPGEVYSAMERGVVVGYGWPVFGISDWGWDAVTKYAVEPSFYQVDTIGLVNREKWNALSDEAKKLLTDTAVAMEGKMQEYFKELIAADGQKLAEKGIKVVQLPPDEAETYLKTAYEAVWKQVLQACPENGPEMQRLLTKK
ncbi:MAG: TRAP transporter substrate-binding protein DctP [Moorellales bacterium]